MNKIIFTDITEQVPEKFYPRPAKKQLPEWFLSLPPFHFGKANQGGRFKEMGESTAKRCLPLLDASSAGYIIPLPFDFYVSENEEGFKVYEWADGSEEKISFHAREQVSTKDVSNKYFALPKITNPWSMATPAGYSSLFIPPVNHENLPITIFSGMVDTDEYKANVNFPFVLTDENFTGLIPAGTPIAQVVPIRREAFKMRIGKKKDFENAEKVWLFSKHSMLNMYRNNFWKRKEYN